MNEALYGCEVSARGRKVAGGSIAVGDLLIISAANTVTKPTSGTRPTHVALTAAASGEEVEVLNIGCGHEFRVRCEGSVTAATALEPILTGGNAGKVQTFGSGTAYFIAVEGASDEGLVKVVRI